MRALDTRLFVQSLSSETRLWTLSTKVGTQIQSVNSSFSYMNHLQSAKFKICAWNFDTAESLEVQGEKYELTSH